MTAVEMSVVIPTCNRVRTLSEVLAAVESQVDAPPFEIVVVDDGSADGTADFLGRRRFPVPATVVGQPNKGPAAARNAGVAAATGELVVLLGDDMVPSRRWLAVHREGHRRRGDDQSLAVIGHTRWHRRVRATPFLRYVNDYGLQFGYALIEDPEALPFTFFYASNASLRRRRLVEEPFDERFPTAAYEDTEVAYRLQKRGLRLVYEAGAGVDHDHPSDLSSFARRQEAAGYASVLLWRLHPELGPVLGIGAGGPPPLAGARSLRMLERVVRGMQHAPVSMPPLWRRVLRQHYVRGMHRAWADAL